MLFRTTGLAIALLSLATSASAQLLPIPAKTTGLSPIKGNITQVQSVRVPRGEAVTGVETRITLKFTLQGCLDSLMPLVSHHEVKGQQAIVYVTALNAHNEESRVAQCFAIPEATGQVSIPGIFQRNQIRVVFLGQPPRP